MGRGRDGDGPVAGLHFFTPASQFVTTVSGGDTASELATALEKGPPWPWRELAFACLDRDFVRAADVCAEGGGPTWEAQLRLRAAEELAEAGRLAEAEEQSVRALAFYRSVGATYFIERAAKLLAKSA